jgi:glycosyltransferase 2 family protein
LVTDRTKKIAKILAKICITVLAIYVVYQKIDTQKLFQIIKSVNIAWFALALITFNLSKILSAYRLNTFFKNIELIVNDALNIRLYYIGMFYNLFLPGGVGGDGYKVYWLRKYYKSKVKDLVLATLIDRISGLIALFFLFIILFIVIIDNSKYHWGFLNWFGLIAIYPIFWIAIQWLIPKFKSSFLTTNIQSLSVQVLQLICAMFILISLGVQQQYLEYQAVFLVSSVVAVLPFTIGGIGARELVFVQSSNLLNIEINTAVAFSILFFTITAISSFSGAFLNLKSQDKNINELS